MLGDQADFPTPTVRVSDCCCLAADVVIIIWYAGSGVNTVYISECPLFCLLVCLCCQNIYSALFENISLSCFNTFKRNIKYSCTISLTSPPLKMKYSNIISLSCLSGLSAAQIWAAPGGGGWGWGPGYNGPECAVRYTQPKCIIPVRVLF